MFAGMAVLAFVLLIGAIVDWAERRMLRWKPSQNSLVLDRFPRNKIFRDRQTNRDTTVALGRSADGTIKQPF
jgi:hypothetical protein